MKGVPKDYIPQKIIVNQASADFTDYPDDDFVMTTQPAQDLGQTIDNVPDGWSECYISGYAKRQILSTPGFPQPIRRPLKKSYQIKEIPSKGLGIVATRDILAGDLIFAERAIIIWPVQFRSRHPAHYTQEQAKQVGLFEKEKIMEVLFDRVDPKLQAAYKALHNSHQFDGSGPLGGIGRTNGFAIELNDVGKLTFSDVLGLVD